MPPQSNASRWLSILPFAFFFILFVWLGRWQLQRMHEKEALFAEFESGGLITLPLSRTDPGLHQRYQKVIASGRYDSDHQVLLDNMTHQGRVGYRVLTPLIDAHQVTVLVDRGWIPMGPTRSQLPDVAVAQHLRGVSGKLDFPPQAGLKLAAARGSGWPRVVSYPSMTELEQILGRPLFPRILLLDADQADGFVRQWRPATFGPERHLSYAVTWFALAATVAIAYAVVNLRSRKP